LIQLSSLLPAIAHGPVRPQLLASGAAASFALALKASAADPGAAPVVAEAVGDTLLPGRQNAAAPGTELPDPLLDDGTDADADAEADAEIDLEDEVEAASAIASAWFALSPAAPPVPSAIHPVAVAPVAVMRDGVATPVDRLPPEASSIAPAAPAVEEPDAGHGVQPMPELGGGPVPASGSSPVERVLPDELIDALPTAPLDLPKPDWTGSPAPLRPTLAAAAEAPSPAKVDLAKPAPTFPVDPRPAAHAEPASRTATVPSITATLAQRLHSTEPVQAPRRSASPKPSQSSQPSRAPQLQLAPVPSLATPAVAAEVVPLGIALSASASPFPPAPRRMPALESAALSIAPAAPEAAQPAGVSALAEPQQAPLDTRRQEWIGKMVEHIEALRDSAPMRETRISLAPEVLGRVDVAIRHDGDRVQVHFTTETLAARQLIADAQPRLNELAEARGLKLGATSFESGTAGQSPQRDGREQPLPQPTLKPRSASIFEAAAETADDRIA
jgi:flagellar hook-length control protein FliK